MASQRALTCVGALGLALAICGEARAQMTPMPSSGGGMCAGTIDTGAGMAALAGSTYLVIGEGDGAVFLPQGVDRVFGRAECECRSRDISLGIKLNSALPRSATGVAASMWVGLAACKDQTTRVMLNTQCEQITALSPPGNGKFTLNSDAFKSIGQSAVRIPAESLTNPKPVGSTDWRWSCELDGTQNRTITVLVGPDQMPATCTLPLSVKTTPPVAPSNLTLRRGDGALTASWSVPDQTAGIEYYQVLCRKKSEPQKPVMSEDFRNNTPYWFSSCVNGTLYRRPISNFTKNMVVPAEPGVLPPPETGTPDLGSTLPDAGASDGGTPDTDAGTSGAVSFPIDGQFICSDRIQATDISLSQRIDGLENGVEYEVMVVSIDPYGNPAPSAVVSGIPVASQSPLQPFCEANSGVCPVGFGCQAAGPSNGFGLGVLCAGLLGGLALLLRHRSLRLFAQRFARVRSLRRVR